MANHKNAKKMVRKIERQTAINKNRRSLVKTAVKKAEIALGVRTHVNDKPLSADAAKALIVEAERQLARAAQKGIMNKKTASRKTSRLALKLKNLAS